MTTTAPDGAYIIGGGKDHFGQTITEDLARAAFEFPMPNFGNMIELLFTMLEQLPLGALRPFQGFLGLGDDDFQSVSQAVEAIITSLKARPIFMLLADFQQWVMDFIFALTGSIRDGDLTKLTAWFKTTVTDVLDTLKTTLTALIDGLWTVIGKVGTGKNVADLIAAFTGAWNTLSNGLQGLIDGLVKAFGGTGTTVAAAVAAITNWLGKTFKDVSDGLATIVKTVKGLVDGLSGVVGGTVAQAVKVVTDVVKTITDLINGLFSLFGGTGTTINLTTMLAAATSWMTNWQKFVDGIWNAFTGGVAGAGKTVADALKAVTDWLGNVFQKLLDEIAKLWGWTPGSGASAIHAGIQDVVDTIAGILGIGQSAASAAATANIGLAALVAAQKSGFSDEFDYPKAAALPAPWTRTGANLWGPSGSGILEYRGPDRIGAGGEEVYKQTRDPIKAATGTITVVLTKPPHSEPLVQSHVGIHAKVSLTDKSCLQWVIEGTSAQLRVVNGAGVATNQGAVQALPKLKGGDVLEMSWTATDSTLRVNNILQATRPWTGTLTGQHIGVLLQTGAYTWLGGGHPAPELAGIAWHP